MLFIVQEEMIFNFCCVLQISEINLGVTLALIAELLLHLDFPMLTLLLLVVVYVPLLRKRLSLAFVFFKNWEGRFHGTLCILVSLLWDRCLLRRQCGPSPGADIRSRGGRGLLSWVPLGLLLRGFALCRAQEWVHQGFDISGCKA